MLAAIGAAVLAATTVGTLGHAAHATDTNAGIVTDVQITDNAGNPLSEASIYDGVVVTARWEAPASASPGDFFAIAWPEEMLRGVPKLEFDIFSDEPGASDPIAVCTVTHTGLRCVYTDYLLTHSNISGHVRYSAQLRAETTSISFTTDAGATFTWDIGVTMPPLPGLVPPETLWKGGHTDTYSGDIYWQVLVNPALFPGVDRINIRDTYESSLSLVTGSLTVGWRPTGATSAEIVTLSPLTDYTFSEDAEHHAFDVSIVSTTTRALGAYILAYHTDVPGEAQEGDVFHNDVTANGLAASGAVKWTIAGGGSGSGSSYGTFEIVKALSGPAEQAGASHHFAGAWSCTLP